MAVDCWLCAGKGQGQIVLRPDGLADGRKVCRVCVRRLFAWLRALPPDARAPTLAPIWPGVLAPDEESTPDCDAARAAFLASVASGLPNADDAARLNIAIGYLEMGVLPRAVEALASVDPAGVDGLRHASLSSLLSRLLHPRLLSAQAKESLERAIYPDPEKRG
jgi:hypothetical protein